MNRLFCPLDSPGKNIGVGCHFLLQGIFPTQGANLGLQHCRRFTVWATREAPYNTNSEFVRSFLGYGVCPGKDFDLFNSCHTSFLSTPQSKQKATQSLLSRFSPKQLRQYTGVTRLQIIRVTVTAHAEKCRRRISNQREKYIMQLIKFE